ncbi:MAG: serine/threonine protein kinase [Planctomycetes bacterium]|nr:serine/threonine protein kinase [Planctomycetota bacterium]
MSQAQIDNEECTERVPIQGRDFLLRRDEMGDEAPSGTFVLERGTDPSTVTEETELILSPDRLALEGRADDSRCGFIPGYSIVGSLGRGGMGIVYQAIQERLQRVVALKVLMPADEANPDYVARFEREAMAVARLNHPNVVTAYDYGEADGRFYLAIEYVEGYDGAELIANQGRIAEADAVAMARDAVLGLSHALSHGIIHRDIKPANLMLTSEAHRDASGGALSGRLKVTDLGLAQIRENAQDLRGGQLDCGKIVGTPSYMAPEQSRGEPVDFRSDIYALGATLYHFVTGIKPYDGDEPFQIIRDKAAMQLVHPQDVVPELTDDFCTVLERMLARSADERHQSYEELLHDLQALLIGRKLARRDAVPSTSIAEPQRRRFKFLQPRRESATPLPFRIRVIEPPSRSPWRRLGPWIRILVPAAIGFALALILF